MLYIWGLRDKGRVCIVEMSLLKIMPIASFFKRLTCLLLNLLYSPSLKNAVGSPMNPHYGGLVNNIKY